MQKPEFSQSLLVTHHEDTSFETLDANNAPRPQFLYRRLGVEEATGGAYDAHVIKGWMSFHYHGHGEHTVNGVEAAPATA